MYTYPNPLNSKISVFHLRQILVAKKKDFEKIKATDFISEQIVRVDKYGNSFYYFLRDEALGEQSNKGSLKTLTDIFDACKHRLPKKRTPSITSIPPIQN